MVLRQFLCWESTETSINAPPAAIVGTLMNFALSWPQKLSENRLCKNFINSAGQAIRSFTPPMHGETSDSNHQLSTIDYRPAMSQLISPLSSVLCPLSSVLFYNRTRTSQCIPNGDSLDHWVCRSNLPELYCGELQTENHYLPPLVGLLYWGSN